MAISTDTLHGWMPDAAKRSVPAMNYAMGNRGRNAVVLHIIEGSASSAIGKFQNRMSRTSAHFVVDAHGAITQLVSVSDSAYANGLSWSEGNHCWVDPQGHLLKAPNPAPAWTGLQPPTNPNLQTISIERAGFYQDIPTADQDAAVVRIMQFIDLLPYVFLSNLIGHLHISPVSKPNCPGPHVRYADLAAAANAPMFRPARVLGLPVYQRADRTGAIWGVLPTGEQVVIDDVRNGHLADARGFVDLHGLEPL